MMTDVEIAHAAETDRDAVLALLAAEGLPTAGLLEHFDAAIVARCAGEVVGSAALELYEDGALLRSVAVAARMRGTGLGARLTTTALARARAHGMPAVYLLTTTADGFFPRFGFARIARADVPPSVQASVEFRSACPASAVVMRKLLLEEWTATSPEARS
jgi:amino-acid N-acetyltransferase